MTTRYVVLNENALGYINDVQPQVVGILASSVFMGGPNPIDGPVAIVPTCDVVRAATADDFEGFRVMLPPDFRG
jgi:hypothetical protein